MTLETIRAPKSQPQIFLAKRFARGQKGGMNTYAFAAIASFVIGNSIAYFGWATLEDKHPNIATLVFIIGFFFSAFATAWFFTFPHP